MSALSELEVAQRARECTDGIRAVEAFMRELARAHGLDLCARMVQDHLATGGKRIRARLALSTVEVLGGQPEAAVPWATACELLHNASLVHDDLQDGDRVRRGQPALWTVHGSAQAINAGDLMLMLPTLALEALDVPDALKWRLSATVARHAARTAAGQAEEMALRTRLRLDRHAYLEAARGKTAGLFGLPVEGGALLAGEGAATAARLSAPFEDLGLAYQLVDDVIDLYGDKGREARGADIREGKVSALVVAHVARHPEDRLWLLGILRRDRDETCDADVAAVIERFRSSGARDDVLADVHALVRRVDDLAHAPALHRVAAALRDRILSPLGDLDG